ncbi:MAG: hypothetical protein E6Q24_20120 [Chitinophagaceae bacterium]|nr:MAG: hypothetical protein E6Q24_20120 [Chitinophagaceae bacterium]
MVTITNYFVRETKEGKTFIALELQGELEMIQSTETGNFYATAKRCTISSTFSEDVAKNLLGKQLPGRIERIQTEPYEYTIRTTGEVITLVHRYVYCPEEKQQMTLEKPVESMVAM